MSNPTNFDQYPNHYQSAQEPYSGYYQQSNKTNVLAILSIVFIGSPVALVLGHIALYQIKRTGEKGRGMAFVFGFFVLGDIATA